jgi:hypothetical protein
MYKFLFCNKFIICLYMFWALCAHHQEIKIVLCSIWYRHTERSEWSKITKTQFYKYEHIVKFMYEFFGCDYCVLLVLTINMLRHVEVLFNQLLNLLEGYYVYLHLCFWVYLLIKSYKLLISCCIYKVMFVRLLKLLKLRCLYTLPI